MVAVGREMKGETVRGIWARRGWDPCGGEGGRSLVRDVKGRAGEGSGKRAYCRCTCLLLIGRWRSTLEYGGWVRGRLTDRSDDLSYFVLEEFGSISKNALSQEIPLEVACIAGVKWLRPRSLKGTSYFSIYDILAHAS